MGKCELGKIDQDNIIWENSFGKVLNIRINTIKYDMIQYNTVDYRIIQK